MCKFIAVVQHKGVSMVIFHFGQMVFEASFETLAPPTASCKEMLSYFRFSVPWTFAIGEGESPLGFVDAGPKGNKKLSRQQKCISTLLSGFDPVLRKRILPLFPPSRLYHDPSESKTQKETVTNPLHARSD